MAFMAGAKVASRTAAGPANTLATWLNWITGASVNILDSRGWEETGSGVMTKSPGSRIKAGSIGVIGFITPGTGYAKRTPMVTLKCLAAGRCDHRWITVPGITPMSRA